MLLYEGVLMPSPTLPVSHSSAPVLVRRSQDDFILHVLCPRREGTRVGVARELFVSLSSVLIQGWE